MATRTSRSSVNTSISSMCTYSLFGTQTVSRGFHDRHGTLLLNTQYSGPRGRPGAAATMAVWHDRHVTMSSMSCCWQDARHGHAITHTNDHHDRTHRSRFETVGACGRPSMPSIVAGIRNPAHAHQYCATTHRPIHSWAASTTTTRTPPHTHTPSHSDVRAHRYNGRAPGRALGGTLGRVAPRWTASPCTPPSSQAG